MPDNVPNEPPPSYATATGSSAAGSSHNNASNHLSVPGKGDGKNVTLDQRRSMEDEGRKLPPGWVRTFDPESHHQFFVDTTKDPPKSIWHHPYDDDDFLATLSSEERERLEEEGTPYRTQSHKDHMISAHSEDDDDDASHPTAGSSSSAELPPRPQQGKGKAPQERSFGRKLKDKMTGMTHEERVAERKKRDEAERRMYEQHQKIRQAMIEAARTGKAVKVGVDNTGREVWVEAPSTNNRFAGTYGPGAYAYDPYGSMGMYTTPNGRYLRPQQPYGRPVYGSGYGYGGPFGGGGMGFAGPGLALGAGAGLGLLAGGLLF